MLLNKRVFSTLNMEAVRIYEASVYSYQGIRRHIPEDSRVHSHHDKKQNPFDLLPSDMKDPYFHCETYIYIQLYLLFTYNIYVKGKVVPVFN
jgi:hypothetical protein